MGAEQGFLPEVGIKCTKLFFEKSNISFKKSLTQGLDCVMLNPPMRKGFIFLLFFRLNKKRGNLFVVEKQERKFSDHRN